MYNEGKLSKCMQQYRAIIAFRQGNLQEIALSYQQKSFPDIRHSPLLPLNITCLIATFNMAAQTTEKLDQLDRKILTVTVCFVV